VVAAGGTRVGAASLGKGQHTGDGSKVTNNPSLETQGKAEQNAGKVEKKVGQIEEVFEK
jgi:uncharacterized protein YjbJ (UPF0337 family)